MGVLHTAGGASPRGFEALYRRHFALVWSLTGHFGVPPGARDDVAQEVWMTIHRRLDAIAPDASTRAWVAAITRNVALHHHRTHVRRERKHEALQHVVFEHAAHDSFESRAAIDWALAQLDADQREVFLLVAVEELSGPEVAEVLAIPLNTVYSRLRLARGRLARVITSLDDERRLATRLHESPAQTSAAQQRVWLLLVPGRGLGALAGTAASGSLGGKLLVAATSALVTVVGTAGVTGFAGRSAHATSIATSSVEAREVAPVADAAPEVAEVPESISPVTAVERTIVERTIAPEPAPQIVVAKVESSAPVAVRSASRRARPPSSATAPREVDDPAPVEAAPPAASANESLAAETRLLGAARRAITAGDEAAALGLLDRHAAEFPQGVLARDREAARDRLRAP